MTLNHPVVGSSPTVPAKMRKLVARVSGFYIKRKVLKRVSKMPEGITIDFGGKLPGEALLVGILSYAETNRATMSQENRDKYDRLLVAQLTGWHNFWVGRGWPGEKV